MIAEPEIFTHAGRDWYVDRCLTEDETREFIRLRSVPGAPRPTREEYRAARAAYFGRRSCCDVCGATDRPTATVTAYGIETNACNDCRGTEE